MPSPNNLPKSSGEETSPNKPSDQPLPEASPPLRWDRIREELARSRYLFNKEQDEQRRWKAQRQPLSALASERLAQALDAVEQALADGLINENGAEIIRQQLQGPVSGIDGLIDLILSGALFDAPPAQQVRADTTDEAAPDEDSRGTLYITMRRRRKPTGDTTNSTERTTFGVILRNCEPKNLPTLTSPTSTPTTPSPEVLSGDSSNDS